MHESVTEKSLLYLGRINRNQTESMSTSAESGTVYEFRGSLIFSKHILFVSRELLRYCRLLYR
jgi:hypothetical protein